MILFECDISVIPRVIVYYITIPVSLLTMSVSYFGRLTKKYHKEEHMHDFYLLWWQWYLVISIDILYQDVSVVTGNVKYMYEYIRYARKLFDDQLYAHLPACRGAIYL